MPECPECGSELDVSELDLDVGDVIACEDCGAHLQILDVDEWDLEPIEDVEELDDEEGLEEGYGGNGYFHPTDDDL